MWQPIQRADAIEPRLGQRLDVSTRSEPVDGVAFGKTVGSFGSLALPGPTDRPRDLSFIVPQARDDGGSEARSQKEPAALFTFHAALALLAPGFWLPTPFFLQLFPATPCTADETNFQRSKYEN